MKGKVPARLPDGYDGPRPGYPKDQSKYADPENWKYPVHTPFHARAARRYFDDPRNRQKYAPDEQAYIDAKINEALERFGIVAGRMPEDRQVPGDKELEAMDLHDLLVFFLGTPRLQRAEATEPTAVKVTKRTKDLIQATVKDYDVKLDLTDKRIYHDCPDYERRATAGLLCKHLGALFLQLPENVAVPLLRRLVREREKWIF